MSRRPASAPEEADLPQRLLTGLEKIGVVLRSQAWSRLGERGLTPTQAHILALLGARASEPVRLSDVAQSLGVSAPTASDAVTTLQRKDLVTRVASPSDRRSAHLKLTRRGKVAAEHAKQWPQETLAAVRQLPDAEQRALLGGLVRLLRALETAGELPTTRVCPGCENFRANAHPDSDRPHHCALLDLALAEGDVRFDCPSHLPATRR